MTQADALEVEPDDRDRVEAGRRAFECDLPGTAQEFAAILEAAESSGQPDTASAALYGMVRHADDAGEDPLAIIERLRQLAVEQDDDATEALALAWRAWTWMMREEAGYLAGASVDLARATVMLETSSGDEVVRASAHLRLAFCYVQRRLWELADEQYTAAATMVDAVDPAGKDPLLHRAALAYNRVLLQIEWACALRQVGDLDGVGVRRDEYLAALEEAMLIAMPHDWRDELRLSGLLMDSVAGLDRTADVVAHLESPDALESWIGELNLSLALSPDVIGLDQAAVAAERVIERLSAADEPCYYDLALYQACLLESLSLGRRTAGLRALERLTEQRDQDRSAALLSLRSLLAAERLRAEHDLLSRHAYLDHLTGMANRRALDRYLSDLRARGVETAAMLVMDVDNFKAANDRFGHGAGDAVLRRLGAIFASSVRTGDFAARLGGDEFVIVMAGSGSMPARERADAIVRAIAETSWSDIVPDFAVSVSIGVSADSLEHIDAMAARADAALYKAKEIGGAVSESF